MAIHTIPVPNGWSVEQAWEAIRRGEPLPIGLGERPVCWMNIDDETGLEIPDEEE